MQKEEKRVDITEIKTELRKGNTGPLYKYMRNKKKGNTATVNIEES